MQERRSRPYATSSVRQTASALLHKYRWMPGAATIADGAALAAALLVDAHLVLQLGAALALLCCSYIWGYSSSAARQRRWPALAHLPRRQ
jgi:hypothetical protein